MDYAGEQPSGRGSALRQSKLRYPLRSATRPNVAAAADSSAPKRANVASDVTKSVSVLDLSGNKPVKPPRRNSITTKAGSSPRPSCGSETPGSLIRARKSESRIGTPSSEMSSALGRRKFSMLSSVSYWITQIRLSEAASKHSVSLGFFKLALDAGCEPLDRMREELKTYVARHGLATEQEDAVKDLLQAYNIASEFEKLKVSNPAVKVENEDNTASVPKVGRNGSLKPRALGSGSLLTNESSKKESTQKGKPGLKAKSSNSKNPVRRAAAKDSKATVPEKVEKDNEDAANGVRSSFSDEFLDEQDDVRAKVAVSYGDKENSEIQMFEDVVAAVAV